MSEKIEKYVNVSFKFKTTKKIVEEWTWTSGTNFHKFNE